MTKQSQLNAAASWKERQAAKGLKQFNMWIPADIDNNEIREVIKEHIEKRG